MTTRGQLDTQVDPARMARVCTIHKVPLKDLDCPGRNGRGGHRCTRWLTVDLHRRRVLSEADAEEGHVRELHVSLDRGTEGDMPKGIPGSGPRGRKDLAGWTTRGERVLARARLTSGEHVLMVRLEVSKTDNNPQARYRVVWDMRTIGSKQTSRGTHAAMATEAQAKEAYDGALKKAHADRWEDAPLFGSGRLQIRPVPPPPGPKGRRS